MHVSDKCRYLYQREKKFRFPSVYIYSGSGIIVHNALYYVCIVGAHEKGNGNGGYCPSVLVISYAVHGDQLRKRILCGYYTVSRIVLRSAPGFACSREKIGIHCFFFLPAFCFLLSYDKKHVLPAKLAYAELSFCNWRC